MSNTIDVFTNQKNQALDLLQKLADFIREGNELGVQTHPELLSKVKDSLSSVQNEKLKVALIGGFSEGKTSIAAAWMERLDKESMKISHAESSNEVKIYEVEGKLQLIDTPGLFGFKEKMNADTNAIEKYKDITKRYVSEAHLVLYVMNSKNSIKESHFDDLKWLFRTLNLLPRTVFVLSRFDEVADVSDESDYKKSLAIKKEAVINGLDRALDLSPEERSQLSIVAVSANPDDYGTEHWLAHLEEFKKLSHIEMLQDATKSKIEKNGGALALAAEVKKSVIFDVIERQMPVAKQNFEDLQERAIRFKEMRNEQIDELNKITQKIADAKIKIRGQIIRYFAGLIQQAEGASIETISDFINLEVGSDGILIDQKIQEFFHNEVTSITGGITQIQIKVNSEQAQIDDVLAALGKQGFNFVVKKGITKENVLFVRDGISGIAKFAGVDLGKMLKFKPWGATKLAGNLAAGVGLAMELWDSVEKAQREKEFRENVQSMLQNFNEQRNELIAKIDSSTFQDHFFPSYGELTTQLENLQEEFEQLTAKHDRFQRWYKFGQEVSDVAFREI
jgi:GTP-binding protein EngB required for normal cell division